MLQVLSPQLSPYTVNSESDASATATPASDPRLTVLRQSPPQNPGAVSPVPLDASPVAGHGASKNPQQRKEEIRKRNEEYFERYKQEALEKEKR